MKISGLDVDDDLLCLLCKTFFLFCQKIIETPGGNAV